MTDEIDILRKALKEHDKALRFKKINEELYAHLTGSLYYLIKYAEKHDISLPEKDLLLRMVEKADYIIDQFANQPRGDTENNQPSSTQNHFKNWISQVNEN